MRTLVLSLIALVLGSAGPTFAQTPGTSDPASGLDGEVRRIASQYSLWPGFEPAAIPLAVFDGKRTFLFRHPAPPEGFVLIDGKDTGTYVYAGRHPSVTANTSADIGGTMSATVMLDGLVKSADLARLAAIALHEAFHVFQRQRHPGWQANEADLFVYPVEEHDLLVLRRLETEALRRALIAKDQEESACWADEALVLRRQRFETLDEPFVAYERKTELNEGLAAYVQVRAEADDSVQIPVTGFPVADVRQRAYSTGSVLALLLDRFKPGWAVGFEAGESSSLEEALEEALKDQSSCVYEFSPGEMEAVKLAAERDIEGLLTSRGERRKQFQEIPGWRVIFETAKGEPLWPRGFDPLNVVRLGQGVIHTRFLKLGNDSGEMEAIDTAGTDLEALTTGAGAHPLFNGVQRVVIAGLAEPRVEITGSTVSVHTEGFAAGFSGVEVIRNSEELVLRLVPGND